MPAAQSKKRAPAKRKKPAKKAKAKKPAVEKLNLPWGVSVWSPVDWDHRTVDRERCRASVHTPERQRTAYYFHQCTRKVKLEEHGVGWCNTHAPSKADARQHEADQFETVRRGIKWLEKEVGGAYLDKRRWGEGKAKAARAAEAAYQKLVRAKSKLMKLAQQREKARKGKKR